MYGVPKNSKVAASMIWELYEENLKYILGGSFDNKFADVALRAGNLLKDGVGCEASEVASVISIDVNGLKIVNDTLGHKAGDALIYTVAATLSDAFFDIGRCYRIRGLSFHAPQYETAGHFPFSLAAGHSLCYTDKK